MKIDILTLFPEMFDGFLGESIIKRAIDKKLVKFRIINIRNYTTYSNNQVDDYGYGGGSGMILMIEPLYNAIKSIKKKDSHIIFMSPRGKVFKQSYAMSLKDKKHLILICGHYEGVDERIKHFIDEEISIGDYVLTGGEIPSMVISDTIVRLLDGVINKESLESESFNDNLLDYPVYTKPREFKGLKVPDILLSGDHKKIKEYRDNERLRITNENRKDLIK
jgi:tRNA (guanine37-N1)-methyltransferase